MLICIVLKEAPTTSIKLERETAYPSLICDVNSGTTSIIRRETKRRRGGRKRCNDNRTFRGRPKTLSKRPKPAAVENKTEEKVEQYEDIEGKRRRKLVNYVELGKEYEGSDVSEEEKDPSYMPENKSEISVDSDLSDAENAKFWDKLDRDVYINDPLYKSQTKNGGPDPFVHSVCSKCDNYSLFYAMNCVFCSQQRTIKDREPPETASGRPGKKTHTIHTCQCIN